VPHTGNAGILSKHTLIAPGAKTPCQQGATKMRVMHTHEWPLLASKVVPLEALNSLSLSVDNVACEFQLSATNFDGKG
jgi:hypothetical protein